MTIPQDSQQKLVFHRIIKKRHIYDENSVQNSEFVKKKTWQQKTNSYILLTSFITKTLFSQSNF